MYTGDEDDTYCDDGWTSRDATRGGMVPRVEGKLWFSLLGAGCAGGDSNSG